MTTEVPDLSAKTDREILALAFEHVQCVTDAGPTDEGWKSPELRALTDEMERRVEQRDRPWILAGALIHKRVGVGSWSKEADALEVMANTIPASEAWGERG